MKHSDEIQAARKYAEFGLLRIMSSCVVAALEASVYFLSLLGPVFWIYNHRAYSAVWIVVMLLASYVWAGGMFLVLLVAIKRLLIGRIPTGHVSTRSKEASHWYLAVSLISIFDRSPFRGLTEINVVAPWFLRGMGGQIPPSAAFGLRALVFEPWFVKMGRNVGVGAHAVILGHIAVGEELILGSVVIGDNVTIGMRSVIFPEVQIGNDVTIGAGAVVTRGTIIPDGETWVGVPAKPLRKPCDGDPRSKN